MELIIHVEPSIFRLDGKIPRIDSVSAVSTVLVFGTHECLKT